MAFLDIFKKKPTPPATTSKMLAGTAGKAEIKEEVKKEKKITKETRKRIVANVLSLPHISEKARMLQAQNQYVFKVIPGATKYGVKDSVETQYGVKVEKVAMIRVSSKSIRVGKRMGEKQGYKKAVVKLKEGYKIETMQ